MTINELMLKLYELSDNIEDDPEVFIQIGTQQCRINGISYFPETENICDERIVIGNSSRSYLIL